MVKGTVSITLSDFQGLLEAATKAKETEEKKKKEEEKARRRRISFLGFRIGFKTSVVCSFWNFVIIIAKVGTIGIRYGWSQSVTNPL